MKIIYSVAVGVGAFFALNCGSGDEGGYGSGSGNGNGNGSAAQTSDSTQASPKVASDVVEVKVNGHDFDPPEVRIKANQTVRWVWVTGTHNVISGTACSPDGTFSSGSTDSTPSTFEHTFEKAGSFPYFCDPHCSVGMKGKVIVE
jgi:plastocyanin